MYAGPAARARNLSIGLPSSEYSCVSAYSWEAAQYSARMLHSFARAPTVWRAAFRPVATASVALLARAPHRPLWQAARRPASASLALGAAWTCAWSSAALAEEDGKEAAADAQSGETNPMTGESDSKLPDPDNTEEIEEALNCPCIDGMKEGPCGDTFVVAYRCFLESKAEERGSDCLEQFQGMQACFMEHADYYEKKDADAKAAAAAEEEAEENKPEWQKHLEKEKNKSGVWA